MNKLSDNIPLISKSFLLLIVIGLAVCFANQPWCGDDLTYGYSMEGIPAWKYPAVCGFHWLHANGRMANYLAILIMNYTPTWLIAVVNALVTGMFFWMILSISKPGKKSVVMTVGVIAFVLLSFCWWDSFFLFDVSLNYVWAVTFGLVWAWWIVNNKTSHNILLCEIGVIFSFIAGCMHEAMSLPLITGLLAWIIIGKRWGTMDKKIRWFVIAFAIGALCVISSPGIWNRFGSERQADDTMAMILLKSDWLALSMILVIAVFMIFKTARKEFVKAIKTTDLPIWIVAALCSMMFSAVGGIVGRSGWFASTFALIAIVRMLYPYIKIGRKVAGIVAGVLIAISLLHMEEYVCWQIRTGKETREVCELYKASPDSPVYYDYTYLDEVPWWVLNKLRMVPDPDNFHELNMMKRYLGDGTSDVVILPTEIKDISKEKLYSEKQIEVRHGFITLHRLSTDDRNIHITGKGEQMMVVPFTISNFADTVYYVTPRQINPGDR